MGNTSLWSVALSAPAFCFGYTFYMCIGCNTYSTNYNYNNNYNNSYNYNNNYIYNYIYMVGSG